MSHPDIEQVAAIIRGVAAETILPRFRKPELACIRQKTGPHDLVTLADTEAEAALTRQVLALVPGSVVVGEEACSADPGLVGAIADAGAVWVIDPVDGTLNFATGVPLFGVIVAYAVNGETKAAWIYDPIRDRMAMGAAGEGTWLDGRRVTLAPPPSLTAMHGALNLRGGDRRRAARMAERADRMASLLVLRCGAQEYLTILDGGLHFSVYPNVMPWDHAAGAMLVTEAGGTARRLDGRPYRVGDPPPGPPLLVAAGEAAWRQVFEALIGEEG